ncbi:MAG: hypothetical protein IIX96_04185, partial [Clostridia bacterium]|nr:hypothetical protein [Clostridia bacterium]
PHSKNAIIMHFNIISQIFRLSSIFPKKSEKIFLWQKATTAHGKEKKQERMPFSILALVHCIK